MSGCDCECPKCSTEEGLEEEVDTSEFEEKKSTDPSIAAYKDALEKLTGIIKTASQSSDGKELADDYWKEVGQLLKKAKLGISMKELGIDPDDENPVATTKDTEIEPMGDVRDGESQADNAAEDEEGGDQEAPAAGGQEAPAAAPEKEAPAPAEKEAPPAKKEEPDDSKDKEKDDSKDKETDDSKDKEKDDSEDKEKDDSDDDSAEKADGALADVADDHYVGEEKKSRFNLDEEAKSASQQRLFGMVHAYKQGKLDKKKVKPSLWEKIKNIAKRISDKEAEKFAKTKHTDLPERLPATEVIHQTIDELRHLGIILEAEECKVLSITPYDVGFIMEVKSNGKTHLLAIGDVVILEGEGYSFVLGSTSNFGRVANTLKTLTKLEDYELIQEYHRELSASVL